ncbi:MAG: hypothetical protein HC872_05305 [Gammaproteobacteria bacterium]|nr:hypothetical protein [Gammaproteobacteria bacterium]
MRTLLYPPGEVNLIPAADHPMWAKLIKGEVKHQFAQASASMLLFTLQRDYKRDPAKLSEQIAQARASSKSMSARSVRISKTFSPSKAVGVVAHAHHHPAGRQAHCGR